MEIFKTNEKKKPTPFGELEEGDVFLYIGSYFMKIESLEVNTHELSDDDFRNAVNLLDGDLVCFANAENVMHRPEAKMMVNDE